MPSREARQDPNLACLGTPTPDQGSQARAACRAGEVEGRLDYASFGAVHCPCSLLAVPLRKRYAGFLQLADLVALGEVSRDPNMAGAREDSAKSSVRQSCRGSDGEVQEPDTREHACCLRKFNPRTPSFAGNSTFEPCCCQSSNQHGKNVRRLRLKCLTWMPRGILIAIQLNGAAPRAIQDVSLLDESASSDRQLDACK